MSINIIAAIDKSNALGNGNKLLCHLPNDLKRFKQLTQNNFVIMGRKTYDSIGHPLPNRHNIILTRNKKYKAPTGTFVYNSLIEVIEKYHSHNNDEQDLWVIGGSEIYYQALPFADRIYLTIIDNKFENADAHFPRFSLDEWKVVESIHNPADENNEYGHFFVTYQRKQNINKL